MYAIRSYYVNVKVLLLPDGEDPDSFSRAMSSSQLTAYIEENETDFIRFKTKLLMAGAANDPIEKARLVNDIVRSIAIVPDAITRSIYIQDCSRLMDVQEEVLYEQVRKIIQKQTEELQKKSYNFV